MNPSRRHFLRQSAIVGGAFLGLRHLAGCASGPHPSTPVGPHPDLVEDPEGILNLPKGFRYTVLSRTGERMDDGFLVPGAHDGMAAFPGPDGRTILVRNHELLPGDVRMGPFGPKNQLFKNIDREMMYDAGKGKQPGLGGTTTLVYDTKNLLLERHFLSLAGTVRNCAGGPTPWGSWVTCEESVLRVKDPIEKDHGYCFEVPASATPGLAKPVPLTAMGRFNHEAIAVDPKSGVVYLTEDRGEKRDPLPEELLPGLEKPKPKPEELGAGLLYRYIPEVPGQLARGGKLQAMRIQDKPGIHTGNWGGDRIPVGQALEVGWVDMENIDSPKDDLRHQGRAKGAAGFQRGEGIWTGSDGIYFACTDGGSRKKGQIWRYRPSPDEGKPAEKDKPGRLELYLEPDDPDVLEMCDNISVAPWGDLLICEDGPRGNFLLGVTPQGRIYKIAQNAINRWEFAGVAVSPDGGTLFANIQKPGLTVAITGPLAKLSQPAPAAR